MSASSGTLQAAALAGEGRTLKFNVLGSTFRCPRTRQFHSSRSSCRNPRCSFLPHPPGSRRPHHNDHLRPGRKGLFDALLSISREDDDAGVTFNAMEKMGRLRIRESVMGIVDCASRPEQRVYFIEEQNRATGFCFIKYVVQILSVSPMY